MDICDVALSYILSLSPIECVSLHKYYGNSCAILSQKPSEIYRMLNKSSKAQSYESDKLIKQAESAIRFMNSMGIKQLRYDMKGFPCGLKEIPDMPFCIYLRGDIGFDYDYSISIVGTRKPDHFGINETVRFTAGLAKVGYTIVSGLAKGIDTVAHDTALKSNTKTIAVLGSGIDTIYPPGNKRLAVDIIESNGALISEYPPGVPPNRWHFPKRNRIIAALTKGVLMIQSPAKSGSIITGLLAVDYNRELFVANGNDSAVFEGNKRMIDCGGQAVNAPEEIEEMINNSRKTLFDAVWA